MDLGIHGRTAVIAGASLGIGKAVAAAFSREGLNVALLSRDRSRLAKIRSELLEVPNGGEVLDVPTDVTHVDEVDAAAVVIFDRLGPTHIVVNNAGNRMRPGRQIRWSDEELIGDVDVKLFGMLRVVRAFEAHIPSDGTGRIVNISGVAGSIVWETAMTHGINNSAMNHVTRYLAADLAPRSITVNAVIPGLIATEWRHDWAASSADRDGISKEAFVDRVSREKGILLRRWAEPGEVADAVLFLASDRAAYITGTTLHVDGGLSANAR